MPSKCVANSLLWNRHPLENISLEKARAGTQVSNATVVVQTGGEVGWQAKYLFHWNDSLKNQLDHSIRTALNKHPNLVEYVVCLPFDLSDSRRCGGELLECQNRLFPKWGGIFERRVYWALRPEGICRRRWFSQE